jgi:hypothetical protein
MEPRPSDKFPHRFPMLPAAMACLSVAGCGTAAPPDHGLAPERLARLHAICTDTMQLSRGDVHFEDCMDVLSETARRANLVRSQP